MSVSRVAVAGIVASLVTSACSSGGSCGSASLTAADCASGLRFREHSFLEIDLGRRIPRGEELGDGTYPPCSDNPCAESSGLGGFGATDVWRLQGVDPTMAVVGLREGTHKYVVFARPGTTASDLVPLLGS